MSWGGVCQNGKPTQLLLTKTHPEGFLTLIFFKKKKKQKKNHKNQKTFIANFSFASASGLYHSYLTNRNLLKEI